MWGDVVGELSRPAHDPQRILDFDLENRPLNYLGSDWTGAEITAIAWSWVGSPKVEALLLTPSGYWEDNAGVLRPMLNGLEWFRSKLIEADMVTGHYIRKHDLPLLNSAFMEHGLDPLPPKLVQDTQQDLVRRKDLSASQENLAAMFGLPEAKHHMDQTEWRTANRLGAEGRDKSRKRVVDDVIQHKALRTALIERKLLRAPRMWYS